MQCSKCGNEIAEGMRFCPTCGAPVEQPAVSVAAPEAEQSTSVKPAAKRTTRAKAKPKAAKKTTRTTNAAAEAAPTSEATTTGEVPPADKAEKATVKSKAAPRKRSTGTRKKTTTKAAAPASDPAAPAVPAPASDPAAPAVPAPASIPPAKPASAPAPKPAASAPAPAPEPEPEPELAFPRVIHPEVRIEPGTPDAAERIKPGAISYGPPKADDSASVGFGILSFFLPPVGLILWLTWRADDPLKARSCAIGALIGLGAFVAVGLVIAALSGMFVVANGGLPR